MAEDPVAPIESIDARIQSAVIESQAEKPSCEAFRDAMRPILQRGGQKARASDDAQEILAHLSTYPGVSPARHLVLRTILETPSVDERQAEELYDCPILPYLSGVSRLLDGLSTAPRSSEAGAQLRTIVLRNAKRDLSGPSSVLFVMVHASLLDRLATAGLFGNDEDGAAPLVHALTAEAKRQRERIFSADGKTNLGVRAELQMMEGIRTKLLEFVRSQLAA